MLLRWFMRNGTFFLECVLLSKNRLAEWQENISDLRCVMIFVYWCWTLARLTYELHRVRLGVCKPTRRRRIECEPGFQYLYLKKGGEKSIVPVRTLLMVVSRIVCRKNAHHDRLPLLSEKNLDGRIFGSCHAIDFDEHEFHIRELKHSTACF